VWGSAIINKSTYPGANAGKVEVSFPVRAGAEAQAISRELVADLAADSRVQSPQAKVSKVVNLADGDGVVELTVAATTEPGDADAVKSKLLEAINTYVAARPSALPRPAS
jgi:small conductance mechanosensitive channel